MHLFSLQIMWCVKVMVRDLALIVNCSFLPTIFGNRYTPIASNNRKRIEEIYLQYSISLDTNRRKLKHHPLRSFLQCRILWIKCRKKNMRHQRAETSPLWTHDKKEKKRCDIRTIGFKNFSRYSQCNHIGTFDQFRALLSLISRKLTYIHTLNLGLIKKYILQENFQIGSELQVLVSLFVID